MIQNTNKKTKKKKMLRLLHSFLRFLDEWLLEPILTLRRLLHILLLFTPVIITSPAIFLGSPVNDNDKSGTIWWYGFIAAQMEKAGPSFIKLAQWIASRTDLFPMSLCQQLSKLHSNVDPHGFSYTKKIIEAAFERPLKDIFIELDREPLGVGAIAQVYKGKLNPELILSWPSQQQKSIQTDFMMDEALETQDVITTKDQYGNEIKLCTSVAIKIIHPKARQIVKRDLKIMKWCATLLSFIPTMHWLSLPDEVTTFGNMMNDQLDLRIEGSHLEKFNQLFAQERDIQFPKPFIYFTTKDMLMEEYENGIPLNIFLNQAMLAKKNGNPSGVFDHKIANIGLNAFLYMLIVYNFVHADLHPGNIMVKFYKPSAHHPFQIAWSKLFNYKLKDDGDLVVHQLRQVQDQPEALNNLLQRLDQEGYVPQLVMIDTGLVNELSEKNRRNFLDLFGAVAKFDGYRVGELMVERCQSPELVIQPDVFALRMQKLILGLKQNTFHLGAVKIGSLLSEVRDMVRTHHVRLEGEFINVVVGIMLLEGIGRQLDPNLDLFKNALPVLREYSIRDGGKNTIEVWIFLELRNWLVRDTRENEWLKMW
ncbi:hypothetical protein BJ944DRAFT_257988 [Cunninghamella echinulata]|nr:hypothetical protein BJ944DRAFT_257988 [Cunninghamella echinulata]